MEINGEQNMTINNLIPSIASRNLLKILILVTSYMIAVSLVKAIKIWDLQKIYSTKIHLPEYQNMININIPLIKIPGGWFLLTKNMSNTCAKLTS